MATIRKVKPFVAQSKAISRHVARFELLGDKNYFSPNDLREIYDKYNGCCIYCGLYMTSVSHSLNAVNFTFKIPIESGGAIVKDNIIPLCWRCKNLRVPKRPPEFPVFSYNAFSDQIVQLIQAVIEKDEDRINFFKANIDASLTNYIGMLFYKPLGTPKQLGLEPYRSNLPISEAMAKLTEEIERNLKQATITKEYRPEYPEKESF